MQPLRTCASTKVSLVIAIFHVDVQPHARACAGTCVSDAEASNMPSSLFHGPRRCI